MGAPSSVYHAVVCPVLVTDWSLPESVGERMRFFRGTAVPEDKADQVITTVRNQGLARDRGESWKMEYRHPGDLDALFAKPDLSLMHTRPDSVEADPGVCACGEEAGAAYYACQHNRTSENTTPIVMEFEAPDEAVSIDGRDFLYTVFQLGEPGLARAALARAFGDAVLRYADRAWSSKEQSVALCDLACHDSQVIKAHHASRIVLGGRFNTVFRNAFIVRLPVEATSVIRVWSPTECPKLPIPEIMFDSLLVESHRRT
ncbi:MAG: hypothetical protein WBA66_13015 [Xanthobacteraceae bacterium]